MYVTPNRMHIFSQLIKKWKKKKQLKKAIKRQAQLDTFQFTSGGPSLLVIGVNFPKITQISVQVPKSPVLGTNMPRITQISVLIPR